MASASSSAGNANQVLGVGVTITGWELGREEDVAGALGRLTAGATLPGPGDLPSLVMETTSKDAAEDAYDLLEAAGATVEISRVWMSPSAGQTAKPACPRCGSTATQPWLHAGPGARVNRSCVDCGHLFKA